MILYLKEIIWSQKECHNEIFSLTMLASNTYFGHNVQVATLAHKLISMGVKKGDRVIIYMPMIPEAVIGMLACARIGAPHSVVFGGFAAPELSKRILHTQPTAILSASCGVEPTRTVWSVKLGSYLGCERFFCS